MKKTILIILVLVVVAGAGAGITYFIMNKNTASKETASINKTKIEQDFEEGNIASKTDNLIQNTVKNETTNKAENKNTSKTTKPNLNSNSAVSKDYEYVFTTNGNAILKSTKNESSPDAEYKVKCQYCGNISFNSYRTFRFSTNWDFPQTQEYNEICTNCKKTTTAEVTCQRIEK